MNHDDRSDRDVCQRRRRRGAYAAVLSAAVGAALAAAMIPAAPAYADPTDDAVAALSNGPTGEELTLNNDLTTYFDDQDLSGLQQFITTTDAYFSSLPGGANGTEAVGFETVDANLTTLYTDDQLPDLQAALTGNDDFLSELSSLPGPLGGLLPGLTETVDNSILTLGIDFSQFFVFDAAAVLP